MNKVFILISNLKFINIIKCTLIEYVTINILTDKNMIIIILITNKAKLP